ncbi:hypothetical protein F5Y04DRAFT_3008 [Hypomontagnella monticulosa]|nr:hypothetical protein F5Y04DRAFT_3008 [Hypomontagnella monticulosa]
MATITIRVETAMGREREVVDLTVASREQSVEIIPPPMSDKFGGGRSPSRTLSPELPATERQEVISELSGRPASYKGKGSRRSPSPVMLFRGKVEETVGSSRTVTAEASSRTVSEHPTTPKRNRSTATASSSRSRIKKRSPSPSPAPSRRGLQSRTVIVIKDEPVSDSDSPPPTPIKKVEDSDSESDGIEISPAIKRYASPGFGVDLSVIPFQRSSSPSPMSRAGRPGPGPGPGPHPDFPTRPPLKCPKKNPEHKTIETAVSGSIRNLDRTYYKCKDCPNYGAFICWADTKGIFGDNPRCNCGYLSRQDITGESSRQPDTLWYKCATNACGFRRYDWDDPLTAEEVNQYCGQRVY